MGEMTGDLTEYTDALGGLPFLDASFRPTTLLGVAAAIRRRWDSIPGATLAEYLNPERAREIFLRHARARTDEPASTPVSEEQRSEINKAFAAIVSTRPDWNALFELPVRYRVLLDDRLSVTSALIPQIIYLGPSALGDHDVLTDVIVHEYSHLWLNLIAETSDLQVPNARQAFTLPSGTPGKPARGVLLAAHFAAATHAYHVSRSNDSWAAPRFDYLINCIDMLNGSTEITPMGEFVLGRLRAYANSAGPAM